MKNLILLVLGLFMFTQPSHAQYSCSDVSRLEQILNDLRASCGSTPGVSFCRAGGRVGASVDEAINNCYNGTANTRAQCEADLTCNSNIGFCRAGGRVGSTVDTAINNCYNGTANTRAQCEADLSCQGGIGFCRAGGRVGSGVTDTINNCYNGTANTRAQCEADLHCY